MKDIRQSLPERLIAIRDAQRTKGQAEEPLTWGDVGFLCDGLAFAPRVLRLAMEPLARRHDLGPRGVWILQLLDLGLAFPHELSDILGIGRSLVTNELNRLTEAALIERQQGTDDRRTMRLGLTEAGRAAVEESRKNLVDIIAHGLDGYSPAEVRGFAEMLFRLRRVNDLP